MSSLTQLQSSIARTQELLSQAQNIAYSVQQIDHSVFDDLRDRDRPASPVRRYDRQRSDSAGRTRSAHCRTA